jgi:uncharacterized protein
VITVTGVGHADGTPDVVRVRATATALRPAAGEALAATEATATAVRAALDRHGITGAQAASGLFSLGAEQVWTEHGPRVTGYRCDHEIRVVVAQVPSVGQVLADVLAAGGDGVRVDDVTPGLRDAGPARALARERAWADALDRATRLAALAGRELGPVWRIVEGGPSGDGAVPIALRAESASAGDAGAVTPGDVEVVVSLTVRWALG